MPTVPKQSRPVHAPYNSSDDYYFDQFQLSLENTAPCLRIGHTKRNWPKKFQFRDELLIRVPALWYSVTDPILLIQRPIFHEPYSSTIFNRSRIIRIFVNSSSLISEISFIEENQAIRGRNNKKKSKNNIDRAKIVNDFVPKRIKNHGEESRIAISINEISITREKKKKNLLFRSGWQERLRIFSRYLLLTRITSPDKVVHRSRFARHVSDAGDNVDIVSIWLKSRV